MNRVRHSLTMLALALGGAPACSDPAPPEPEVASIVLSVPDTGASIRFRNPLVVTATPQGALGVPLVRVVTWTSVTPALLTVEPLNSQGDSARIRAIGVGAGQVHVRAGDLTRTFRVLVQDTVFSVTISPGALNLVAGDTVSFIATVAGSPSADKTVRWDVNNAMLQTLPSLDSLIRRVQVRAAGVATVRALAVADTTKVASTTITAQVGKLAFLNQPATTAREVAFIPAPVVVVQDALGNVSARATNAITLSVAPGVCSAALTGSVTVNAANGVAQFPRVAVNARCPSLTLAATSAPAAASTTSQSFSVTARGCDAAAAISVTERVPFEGPKDTVRAVVENVDCVVMRGGSQFYSHTYVVTVPFETPVLLLDVTSVAFVPRLEAYLWAEDPLVSWTDSLSETGALSPWYVLGPGTHRFSVTSMAPLGTGAYTISASALPGSIITMGPCRLPASRGVSFTVRAACTFSYAARSGQGDGRAFLIYLPPNKTVTVTQQILPGDLTRDAYLELFDVTNASSIPSLIGSDDNSGGGLTGRDAQFRVNAAPTGRFVEIRALLLGSGLGFFTNLTISP